MATGGTSWSSASDERLKKNIVILENNLEKLSNVRPVSYNFNTDDDSKEKRIGFIAQDWINAQPEVVTTNQGDNDEEEYYTLSYTETIPILCGAIKELKAKNDALEARLVALESRLEG